MLKQKAVDTPAKQVAIRRELLEAYSQGLLSRRDAIRRLGLRDSADLLVALGDEGLPMPLPPQQELDEQTATFVKLWQHG